MSGSLRLDRSVLAGNLVAGGLWLLVPLLVLRSPVLALAGAAYVAVAGAFLAAAYGRGIRTWSGELAVWVLPWLVLTPVGVWLAGPDDTWLLWVLLPVYTLPLYVIWQLTALAVRQALAWRRASRRAVGGA